jgi:hypothetical protein
MDKHELMAVVAIPMIATGVWLHWRIAWYCSEAEEDVKDKKITEEQARRRIALLNWTWPVLTVAGLALLMLALRVISF